MDIPSPPRNFLTTVDVWVQIYNIPVNYYMIDTTDYLASKICHVLEIAYDPKASQKMAYIRAHVRLSISRPALANKLLNLPSGGSVLIEFEYEKLRKRCCASIAINLPMKDPFVLCLIVNLVTVRSQSQVPSRVIVFSLIMVFDYLS